MAEEVAVLVDAIRKAAETYNHVALESLCTRFREAAYRQNVTPGQTKVVLRSLRWIRAFQLMRRVADASLASGLDDPQIVRLFAKLGRQMSEDGMMLPMDKDEAVDVEAKIDDLTQKAMVALETGNRVLADKLYAERSALSTRLYGDEPIGGAGAAA